MLVLLCVATCLRRLLRLLATWSGVRRTSSLLTPNDNRRAAAEAEGFGRAAAVCRELEMIGAAEERADFSQGNVGVRGDECSHGAIARPELDAARAGRVPPRAGEFLEEPSI